MGEVVVVTGGAGFVGSLLTRRLLDRGSRVRVIDNFLYSEQGLAGVEGHPHLEIVRGDICDSALLTEALRDARGVIALGALVGDAACDIDAERAMEINYRSTHHLLKACRRNGVQRLVFASSCSVYGANGEAWLTEESPLSPVSIYARTRVMSEQLLLQEARGLEAVIFRLATVCGTSPRMRFDLMVNTMTACAAVDGRVRVAGGELWRPHLHVGDAADAFVLAIEAPVAPTGIYNVGSDEQNFTIGQVAEKVAQQIEGVSVEHRPPDGDPRSYRVSFARVREVFGFQPRRTVDDAISEVRDLLASGRVDDFRHERFHNAKWVRANARQLGAA
jgi:nucleoside-diphosphate-sugar epimerase